MTILPESRRPLSETIFVGNGEMATLMRSHDWSNTPLGPIKNWPQSLRTSVSTMLASPLPQGVFWGDDYIQFYNDAMIVLYGGNHPQALGHPIPETWPEVWEDRAKPTWEGIKNTGEAVFAEDQLYLLLRFGFLEEAYFTICYSPIWDETGKINGILCTSPETTQQVISQRRLKMLRELATAGNGAKTLQAACLAAADVLNSYDIPFALFYQVTSQGNLAELIASSGLTPDSAAAPSTIALSSNDSEWRLAEVFQTREPQLMTDVIDRFGALSVGPWPESPHSAFILPILSGNKEQVECLLVVGISPRLQFNSEYRSFLELVAQQVESAIATARSYEEERKRAEALAELDRAKTTFFSNVSHEFRTPLTLMLGPIEDALSDREEPLSPSQQQRIEVIQRNGLRLLKLVNTLLDFSRIESERIQAIYEPTDLASFTTELASVFRSAIERANLRFVVDCPALPEPIYVDREMWEKIVLNLISNAFKFTLTGEIAVRLRLVGSQVELAVQDTGIGIPAAELARLFERFYRVKGARGRTFEGSGIGLSLVQELVKLHGGTVEVSSVEGQGSCFRVLIPTGCTHLPAERIGATRTLASTAMGASPYVEEALQWLPEQGSAIQALNSQSQPQTSNIQAQTSNIQAQSPNIQAQSPNIQAQTTRNARVLLIDDNADMRDYVRRLLSQRWQVETAANGAIALELIQAQLPDLVLTDVMMPELDGLQLLRALRVDPRTQSIPVILLSARAGEEATVEGLELGADDYLIKPFSARELLARVEAHLQLARLRQELSANRFKDEFLLTITHELQSPLATVLGWVRLLKNKSLSPETTDRALDAIERNATNEAKLIKDVLDVSSILSGKLRLKAQVVDLVDLIQTVVGTFKPTATTKGIQLITSISSYEWSDVVADGDRLRQVVTHLLDNAIKFTPSGGQVSVELKHLGSEVHITVHDTGIGIRPDFLP